MTLQNIKKKKKKNYIHITFFIEINAVLYSYIN